MRILSVHNKYLIRGGEEESRDSEERILRDGGHLVDSYEEDNKRLSELNPVHLAAKTIWSQESYQIVADKFAKANYDLMHVQNSFPLISPSIYYAAKARDVTVVQTLRNYRLLCPNALFFREGKVCEDCLGKAIPYPGVVNSCYRESVLASGVAASMLIFHRALKTWSNTVDLYIALSQFARDKFIEGGLPAEKIVVKPNFVSPDPGKGFGGGGYALYVGRLSVEKGLDTLLAAWELLDDEMPLKIVGDGPLSKEVLAKTETNANIEWLGRQPMARVHDLMGQAEMLIFPSNWYETFGRVAIEAFAKGTPVVASNIGAIAELVEDGHTGLLFRTGNSADLAVKVNYLANHPNELAAMRENSRATFEAKYTESKNYDRLMEIYAEAKRKQNKK